MERETTLKRSLLKSPIKTTQLKTYVCFYVIQIWNSWKHSFIIVELFKLVSIYSTLQTFHSDLIRKMYHLLFSLTAFQIPKIINTLVNRFWRNSASGSFPIQPHVLHGPRLSLSLLSLQIRASWWTITTRTPSPWCPKFTWYKPFYIIICLHDSIAWCHYSRQLIQYDTSYLKTASSKPT